MKNKIGAIGESVKDIFIKAPVEIISKGKVLSAQKKYLSIPYGEKINIDRVNYDLGGSACNSIVALARLGFDTSFASMMGDDINSDEALGILKAEKVKTNYIKKEKGSSLRFSIILTGPDGERSIMTHKVEHNFRKLDLKKFFKNHNIIYLASINRYSSNIQKDIINLVGKNKNKLYINPSSFQIKNDKVTLKKMISVSEGVCMNKSEAIKFLSKDKITIKEILDTIYGMGTNLVIITLGKKGAVLYDGKSYYKSGIYDIPVKDKAGSGDAFFATYIGATLKGESVEDSLRLATINSAYVADVYGAQRGLLSWSKLKAVLKKVRLKIDKN